MAQVGTNHFFFWLITTIRVQPGHRSDPVQKHEILGGDQAMEWISTIYHVQGEFVQKDYGIFRLLTLTSPLILQPNGHTPQGHPVSKSF